MANETETKPFDFSACPFCGEPLNMKTDFYPGHYSLRGHVFKCHSCQTKYEVSPVIERYEAKKITSEKFLSQSAGDFLEERAERIAKARRKVSNH